CVTQHSLFRKYVVIFVLLVSASLLTSGVVQLALFYQENQAALVTIQREKADGAASRIESFILEIQRLVAGSLSAAPPSVQPDELEQARADLSRLLRQAPAILEVSYVDATGHEQLLLSRVALSEVRSQRDRSQDAAVLGAQAQGTFYGPVYFRDGSEPYMTVAARSGSRNAIVVAEVNLKFIWDLVAGVQVGKAGYAYVVDREGQLVAHPDIALVLRHPDLSSLAQVQAVDAVNAPSVARNLDGRDVLTARAAVNTLGWSVFVEQPLQEAFAPLYASIVRTAVLLVAGLVVAVAASLFVADRMVTPIRALRAGATRIGQGDLNAQIEVHTGDELEALAASFNSMAAQLRESYRTLEQRVEARTRELEDAMTQIEAANHHKSEFLASMSHELRTPLNAIIGFSDALAEQFFGPLNAKQARYVQHISSSGRYLLALINDILDLSKIEAGRMELEVQRFSLAEALETGLTMVRERAVRHGITLNAVIDPAVGTIDGDERKVKQVVYNLLSNAVKFTPDGGRIDVTAQRINECVEVAVRDTGVGIPLEDQARIFDAFQQGDSGATHTQEGTGLGLTLSRQFVELHGGRLWVESTPGEGSTFRFTLPIGRPIEPRAEPEAMVAVHGR
ncbi:MAG: HAMP domain-containing protein, partial [Chloroflexi bacterium]|nr:HAMP domain-containing protein [Chloroflexota bacterium]